MEEQKTINFCEYKQMRDEYFEDKPPPRGMDLAHWRQLITKEFRKHLEEQGIVIYDAEYEQQRKD